MTRPNTGIAFYFLAIIPFTVDCVIDFWRTCQVKVGQRKVLRHAWSLPDGPKDSDPLHMKNTTFVLLDLLEAARSLEDAALAEVVLANLRFRHKLFVKASELYAGVEKVYKPSAIHPVHMQTVKAIFLADILNIETYTNKERSERPFEQAIANAPGFAPGFASDWNKAQTWERCKPYF